MNGTMGSFTGDFRRPVSAAKNSVLGGADFKRL